MDAVKKNLLWLMVTAASCSAVFLLNIKTSHDWGDDFAQYIHQAKNISEGISQQETGYIYNPRFAVLGPPAYPMGFPILLSPVYSWTGNNIKAFNYLISFFLFAFLMACFFYFRKYMSELAAFMMVLILALNPWLLTFKTEINSDIPFSFFAIVTLLAYSRCKRNFINAFLLALAAGFAFSIRTAGITLVIAAFIDQLHAWHKKDSAHSKIFMLIIPAGAICFYLLLNKIIFHLPEGFFAEPASNFTFKKIYDTVLLNLDYYFEVLQSLFGTDRQNPYRFVSTFLMSSVLCFTVIGFIIRMRSSFTVSEWFFSIYIAMLLVYPYSHSGLRFLIPVIPISLVYCTDVIKHLMKSANLYYPKTFIAGCAILFFLFYKPDIKKIQNEERKILRGPQHASAAEAFLYIKGNTKAESNFLFIKPRAMALYTGRNCMSANPQAPVSEISADLKAFEIDYILINNSISDDAIKNYVSAKLTPDNIVWKNDAFCLYKTGN